MDRMRTGGVAAMLALSILCGNQFAALAQSPPAHDVTDAVGRTIHVADTSRIVTIGGAATEIVYALGLGDRVAAVDISSTFPSSALATKPNVGYIRALSPEGVLSVSPSIIIATEGAGPPDAVNVLRSASVPFVTFPEARDPAQLVANIRFVADVLSVPEAGAQVAAAVSQDFEALAAIRAKIVQHRKAVFVLSASANAPVVGGTHTSADAILALGGIDNAMAGMSGFKPAVDEAMLAAEPDAIVLMKDRSHNLSDDAVIALPAFAGTPAAAKRHIYRIDGGYALAFGPRTPQAARDLAAAIYPELALPSLPERPWTQSEAKSSTETKPGQ